MNKIKLTAALFALPIVVACGKKEYQVNFPNIQELILPENLVVEKGDSYEANFSVDTKKTNKVLPAEITKIVSGNSVLQVPGDYFYENPDGDKTKGHLIIHADCIVGDITITFELVEPSSIL